MDIIPKCVASIFLFRTLKPPIMQICEVIKETQSPLLMLSFFLLGELRLGGFFKLLPLFLYIHLQYHVSPQLSWDGIKKLKMSDLKEYFNQLKELDKSTLTLTPIICATGFLTGWFVRDPQAINSLPINSFLSHIVTYLFWDILICGAIIYSLKFTDKILLISQFLYLTLFISTEHLSFLFLVIFVLIGLLTKRDQPTSPFLSFYVIEACLTVGTLFTTTPANIFFAFGSLGLVWKLSQLNDGSRKICSKQSPHSPTTSNNSFHCPIIEPLMPTKSTSNSNDAVQEI